MPSSPSADVPVTDARHWSRLYRRGRRRVLGVLLILSPWAWFLIRDTWAPLNMASVAMPAIAVLGGIALFISAGLTRRLLPVFAAISLLSMTTVTVVQPMLPQRAGAIAHPITIASANIYDSNRTPAAAARALAGTHADVLVAVETPDGFAALLASASGATHPYVAESSGFVVRSTFPVTAIPVDSRLSPNRAFEVTLVPPAAPPFTVFAIHAINPIQESSFGAQQSFIERLDRSARARQTAWGPVVIAGDLNLSDRTHGYRILSSHFRDAMRAGAWAGATYEQGVWRLALLRIDHIFVSRTWCAQGPSRFAIPGSDHEGIRATVGPCA